MATATYVQNPTYPNAGGGTVSYGPRNSTFDIGAALLAGGGSFTVTDDSLIAALDKHLLVVRSGGAGTPVTLSPATGPVSATVSAPQVGDALIWDGVKWINSPAGGTELAYASKTDGPYTATTTGPEDVPGLSITFPEPNRPYYLHSSGYALIGQTVAGLVYAVIADGANNQFTAGVSRVNAANVGQTTPIVPVRVTPVTPGQSRTFKVRIGSLGGGLPKLDNGATTPAVLYAVAA